MNKEEINWEKRFDEQYTSMAYGEKWRPGMEFTPSMIKSFIKNLLEPKIENNTLTVEIPKGCKTLDIREKSEGDIHWIEIGLQEESKMCKIRQPHDGIDCPCNMAEKIEKGAKKFAEDFEGVMKI